MTNMIEATGLPELGTPEAAVQTCVNLIARATGQSEEHLAYWLDLYYQVRSVYEDEEKRKRQLSRFRDYFVMPGQDEPKASAPEPPEAPSGTPSPPAEPEDSPQAHSKTNAANAAFKSETRERLLQLRADGLTMARLLELADGTVKEGAIRDIIDAHTVPLAVYRKLAKLLDKIQTET